MEISFWYLPYGRALTQFSLLITNRNNPPSMPPRICT